MLNKEKYKHMAAQLRKPNGLGGIEIAGWMARGNANIIHETIRALTIERDENILEIGMANGVFVKDIVGSAENVQYTGFDFSEIMISEAEEMNKELVYGGRARFVFAGITSMPFPGKSFDKILSVNTIYFWDDEPSALREVLRVLKPGGKFVIGFRPKHQTEKYPFTKVGFRQYSAEDAKTLLYDNGLVVDKLFENIENDFEFDGKKQAMEKIVIVACKI